MESVWKGKKIGFLGDSITEGVGCESGKRYWNYLEQYIGCRSFCFGVNGAVFRDLAGQADRLYRECGEKIDAISVFAGTNDYNGARPIGAFYTEPTEETVTIGYEQDVPKTGKRLHRKLNFDTATFCGSINYTLGHIREFYPTTPIILLTPIHRAYAEFGGDNIQYDELYANRGGIFFEEYLDAVKKAANVWACPIIDLNALCGLYPMNDIHAALYFANRKTDRLHPSAGGHKRIAKVLSCALGGISPIADESEE